MRYRLYDAEFVISKSANVALITLGVAAVFAGTADGLKQIIYNYYGNTDERRADDLRRGALDGARQPDPGARPALVGTSASRETCSCCATILPEVARDMRETASLGEMLDEILARVDRGVRAVRSAAIVNGCVLRARGLSIDEVEAWRTSAFAQDYKRDMCEPSDKLFPIRVHLVPSSDDEEPIGYLLVGPRPDGSIPSRDEQKALKEVSEVHRARDPHGDQARSARSAGRGVDRRQRPAHRGLGGAACRTAAERAPATAHRLSELIIDSLTAFKCKA